MMMASKQDEPEDKVATADGLKLMRAFSRIASAEDRRKVIELAVALAAKEK
jgi:hypothetical protein